MVVCVYRRLIVIKAKHLLVLIFSLLVVGACDLPPTPSFSAPSGLLASPEDARVMLEWNAPNVADVAGYNVYRSTERAVAAIVDNRLNAALLPGSPTVYIDETATNGTTYYYVVRAVSRSGAESANSNAASAAPRAGALSRPSVTGVRPPDGATNVPLNRGIGADPDLPNSGIDIETMSQATVRLVRVSDGAQVPANPGTSGGFDTITLQPRSQLEPNTLYRFEVTSGLRDQSGQAFVPFSSTFTTGAGNGGPTGPVDFEQVALPGTVDTHYTQLAVGPDGRLYGATLFGQIHRFDISGDGTLGARQVIETITAEEGAARLLIGLTFDPAATADNLVVWTSHTEFPGFDDRGRPLNGADWTGKITRLSGPNLETAQDFVVGLPRSTKDHVTNSIAFGPDGAMYVSQGANTAMGAPDRTWGYRPERLLSAAVLRIDTNMIDTMIGSGPLNVQTEEGGSYDPFAPNAPLTIYASGIRNAYDLLWHSNGQLYVPTNGSGPGGNIPRSPASVSELPEACTQRLDGSLYTGPFIGDSSLNLGGGVQYDARGDGYSIPTTQNDFLFRVEQSGYYGHPNPRRCEYAFFGGNVATNVATAPDQIREYRSGVQPDPNYRGFAFDFGLNPSTNGVIEYQSDIFDGALQGKLLVVRFALGNDLVVMTPGANGAIVETQEGLPGLSGFLDPLALTENPANGHLYVSEFNRQVSGLSVEGEASFLELAQAGSSPRITLLRPRN
jgi:hypothetical protein